VVWDGAVCLRIAQTESSYHLLDRERVAVRSKVAGQGMRSERHENEIYVGQDTWTTSGVKIHQKSTASIMSLILLHFGDRLDYSVREIE
jgi:hypothetical protein